MKVLNTQGFIAYLSVAFLNAFIDLGHKIIIQNMVFKLYDGQQQIMLTAIVNALILLPFILLFTPAGFISDRFAKHRVIQLTAAMAIAATAVICFAYYQGWFWLAFALTLFLAVQSAIYSPAKYGYIRELVGNEKLTTANGFVQAVTIVSILFATFFFSIIFESLFDQQLLQNAADPASSLLQQIAVIGWILIALAVLEFLISLKLKSTRAGDSSKQLLLSRYLKGEYFKQNIQLIRERRTIMLSIIGLCLFWSISQIVLAAFPAYAKEVLHENNTVVIQGILACTGFGIMLGSL
ncbi:MAG: MFS transporter, partial [Pseudomonadales bacterium]|nr:MFS transporter [Pseudomonadales bacterium]